VRSHLRPLFDLDQAGAIERDLAVEEALIGSIPAASASSL
jgi:hypothetical protein